MIILLNKLSRMWFYFHFHTNEGTENIINIKSWLKPKTTINLFILRWIETRGENKKKILIFVKEKIWKEICIIILLCNGKLIINSVVLKLQYCCKVVVSPCWLYFKIIFFSDLLNFAMSMQLPQILWST